MDALAIDKLMFDVSGMVSMFFPCHSFSVPFLDVHMCRNVQKFMVRLLPSKTGTVKPKPNILISA